MMKCAKSVTFFHWACSIFNLQRRTDSCCCARFISRRSCSKGGCLRGAGPLLTLSWHSFPQQISGRHGLLQMPPPHRSKRDTPSFTSHTVDRKGAEPSSQREPVGKWNLSEVSLNTFFFVYYHNLIQIMKVYYFLSLMTIRFWHFDLHTNLSVKVKS